MDVVTAAGLILRGLAANAVLAAPFVLGLAAYLALSFPSPDALNAPRILGIAVPTLSSLPAIPRFPLTTDLLWIAGAVLLLWAFAKSAATSGVAAFAWLDRSCAELNGAFAGAWKAVAVAIAIAAAVELQPLVLRLVEDPFSLTGCLANASPAACAGKALSAWLRIATPALAPFGAAATFLSHLLGRARRVDGKGRPAGPIRKALATVPLLLAAVVIPSLLWLASLRVAAWAQWHHAPRHGPTPSREDGSSSLASAARSSSP